MPNIEMKIFKNQEQWCKWMTKSFNPTARREAHEIKKSKATQDRELNKKIE
jgi:hypothetical protein